MKSTELAGEKIASILMRALGNAAPFSRIKVSTEDGWIAALPSGTEDVYKRYAECSKDEQHLRRIIEEAQDKADEALHGRERLVTMPATVKASTPVRDSYQQLAFP